MEGKLRDALKIHEENLSLFPEKPVDDKTAQARAEIEEAIETIRELLKELVPPLEEDIDVESERRGDKRKHGSQPKKAIEIEQCLTEFFDKPINFGSLATKHPNFQKFVYSSRDGTSTMDFSDPAGTLELTKVLMREYYDLDWDIPLGYLVPPIPCRAKYISWINDLLQLSSPENASVIGLDIGCGANCIYPLLGASTYRWKFVGTDITDAAVYHANSNKERNPTISHLITVQRIPQDCPDILIPAINQHGNFHFCMCNPPFFTTIDEANQNKRTAFGGKREEMVYPGGEYAFVTKIVEESVSFTDKIHWYTVMLGKKSTFKQIRSQLHTIGVRALRTCTLLQGKQTRWTIAWSFAAKDTNEKPIRQIDAMASSSVFPIESHGRSVDALMSCIVNTIGAHGGIISHRLERKLFVRFPNYNTKGGISEESSLEVLQESSLQFVILLSERAPFPSDLFSKLWSDIQILWSAF